MNCKSIYIEVYFDLAIYNVKDDEWYNSSSSCHAKVEVFVAQTFNIAGRLLLPRRGSTDGRQEEGKNEQHFQKPFRSQLRIW